MPSLIERRLKIKARKLYPSDKTKQKKFVEGVMKLANKNITKTKPQSVIASILSDR